MLSNLVSRARSLTSHTIRGTLTGVSLGACGLAAAALGRNGISETAQVLGITSQGGYGIVLWLHCNDYKLVLKITAAMLLTELGGLAVLACMGYYNDSPIPSYSVS